FNPEATVWPQDGGYHTLEIRRSGRLPGAAATKSAAAAGGFDLFLDGHPVALNVKVTGLGGRLFDAGLSGQTDALGSEYSVSVQSFKVYRAVPEKRRNVRF
ncbi:MAG: hypothetical protein HY721_13820, partial [Planctomycetes bacterium]|nr:hypothetical protein [Planctomycetota bacterium]